MPEIFGAGRHSFASSIASISPTSRRLRCRQEFSTTSIGNLPPIPSIVTRRPANNPGQPAYAMRTAWSKPVSDHPLTFAVAGYYGRQNWSWDRNVDAWAGMTDWQIPIARRLTSLRRVLSWARIGGLGAHRAAVSVRRQSNPIRPGIRGLDSAGGWTQLKFQLTPQAGIERRLRRGQRVLQ
jgi:hypothetical protein